jgi:hypothetical protein
MLQRWQYGRVIFERERIEFNTFKFDGSEIIFWNNESRLALYFHFGHHIFTNPYIDAFFVAGKHIRSREIFAY